MPLFSGSSLSARRRKAGFTMLELLIAVAIVGILAAMAFPSYRESIRRGQRAEARTVMLEAAQFMQRFYSANDRYDTATLPAALARSPATGAQLYTIQIASGVSRTAYTLQAVPQGALTGDKCGTMTMTSVGVRGSGGTATLDYCWR